MDFLERAARTLEADERVRALFLAGSRATGSEDRFSDLDHRFIYTFIRTLCLLPMLLEHAERVRLTQHVQLLKQSLLDTASRSPRPLSASALRPLALAAR